MIADQNNRLSQQNIISLVHTAQESILHFASAKYENVTQETRLQALPVCARVVLGGVFVCECFYIPVCQPFIPACQPFTAPAATPLMMCFWQAR